jgi:hypothetical protein
MESLHEAFHYALSLHLISFKLPERPPEWHRPTPSVDLESQVGHETRDTRHPEISK